MRNSIPFRVGPVLALAATLSVMNTHAQTPERSPAGKLLESARPLVIAHRGFSHFAPENTLPAFQLGVKAGADLVELDYHHTKDGVPVVIHDATLDRTTDAVARWGGEKIRVDSRTAEELRELDAGSWFKPSYAGVRLPSLLEAVREIQSGSVTLIERKAGDAATCVALLRAQGWVNQVVVQSFDWAYLRDFHQQEPRQVLGALGPPGWRGGRQLKDEEKVLDARWVDEVAATGARVVVWNRQINRPAVDYAQRKGLKVWVYTINEVDLAQQLLDLDADGLITDNPALIWKAVALRSAGSSR
jgi:glycerophosphoryl diester phosphodiesterase